MRIAFLGISLFQNGAEYVMALLTRGFVAKGHQVDLILSQYHNVLKQKHPEISPFEVPAETRIEILPQIRGRYMVFSLRKLLKERKYDVVMCHASPYAVPLVLATIGLKDRPLLVNVVHSGGVGLNEHGEMIQPKMSIGSLIFNTITRWYDAQFAVSTGSAEAIARTRGYSREKIHTVYNPVIDDVFRQKIMQPPRHPWLIEKTLPVVVAGGVFYANKNHVMLIQAFAGVLKHRKARLIIFGQGPMLDTYKQTIHDLGLDEFVSLPGFTDNLPAVIKAADCYVVSSICESFSIVCVESLACGTPVVSTRCPYGPEEILQDGKYGILVKNNDVEAMTEGILKVLDGKGVETVPEAWLPYTVEATVDRYLAAFDSILKQKKKD